MSCSAQNLTLGSLGSRSQSAGSIRYLELVLLSQLPMNKFMGLSFQISWRRQGSLRATDDNGLVDTVGSQPSRAASSSLVGSARSPQVPIIGSITGSGRPDWLRRLCPMFSALNGASERCSERGIFKSAQFLPRLKSWASLGTDREG